MNKFLQILICLLFLISINLKASAQIKTFLTEPTSNLQVNLTQNDFRQFVKRIFPFFQFEAEKYPQNTSNILLLFENVPGELKKIFLQKVRKIDRAYLLRESEVMAGNFELTYFKLSFKVNRPNLIVISINNEFYCAGNGTDIRFVKQNGKWTSKIVDQSVTECGPDAWEKPPAMKKKNQ